MSELISIIMPVYNNERQLEKCINSILCQTYKNFELIIINDGSTDSGKEIIDNFAAKDSRIKPIHKENGGVSSARNTGLDNAHGNYITFVDADDLIAPEYLKTLLGVSKQYGSSMTMCGHSNVKSPEEAEMQMKTPCDIVVTKPVSIQEYSSIVKYGSVYCWGILYSADAVSGIRFDQNLSYGEDTMFFFDVFAKQQQFVYVNTALYYYIYNPSSATKQSYSMQRYTEINVWEAVYSKLLHYGDPLKTAIEQKMITVYMHFYYSLAESGNATDKIHRELRDKILAKRRAISMFMKDKNVSFKSGKLKMALFLLPPKLFDLITVFKR